MVAVVTGLDMDLMNPMYQARAQRAAVEFFWTGGQNFHVPEHNSSHCAGILPGLSKADALCWVSNLLWALKKFENPAKVLALWDVLTALLTFSKAAPSFVEEMIAVWTAGFFPVNGDGGDGFSMKIISQLSKVSSRKLQLLNVICRKLVLSNTKDDTTPYLRPHNYQERAEMQTDLWTELLRNSERELRERLAAFTFAAVLYHAANSSEPSLQNSSWFPVGVAQMGSWVAGSEVSVKLVTLLSKIKELGSRVPSLCQRSMEECGYCSAPVPFESEDVAVCKGVSNAETGMTENHKLPRCAVSMQLCSVIVPNWHCICCQRTVDKLPPESFFNMPESPLEGQHDGAIIDVRVRCIPVCPFCGVILQRLMPEFLLSVSPV